MLTKIKNNNKTRMMAAALAFLVSIIIPSAAFAEPGVSITDAQCTNTFQGSERTDFNITVDGLNILTDDVKFEAVGDKLVCSITINNNTADIVEVNSNSAASLSNDHISHSLTSSTGNTIDIDAFKTFVYTVQYVAPYTETQTFNNTLEIKLTADDVVVPNTGAMTTSETGGKEIINIAETVAIVFGVVALVALVMKKSRRQVVSFAALSVLALSAAKFSANALHVATVTVSNKIIVSMETLEPYTDVDVSNLYTLTSNILDNGYDNERFPYNVYATSSTSNNINVSSGDFVSNEVTFLIDHVDAYNQYLIDLTNNGSTDAMYVGGPVITGLTDEQKEFIQVVATYEFGTPMQKGDLIRPGEMKRVLVRVKYKDGYSGPFHTGEVISFNLEFPFVKANYSAKEVNDGAGWLNMRLGSAPMIRTPDNITYYDSRRVKRIESYNPQFSNPRSDGVIVSFQAADELDLSNAVEMDSGEMTEDLSIMQDGSVVAWIELNEDGEDYDGPYSDKKFYDYYVYSKTGSVVVDNCDYLFRETFSYVNKMDLHGFDLNRCTSAHFMLSGVGYSVDGSVQTPFVIDMGDWRGENLYYADDMFLRAGNGNTVSAEIVFSENWNPINLTHASYMFHEFGSHAATVKVDTEGWRLNNLIDASYMYADIGEYNPDGTVIVKAKNMYMPRVKNLSNTFYDVGGYAHAKHVNIDAAGWEYGNVQSMYKMFANTCTGSGRYTDATCDVKFDLKTHGITDFSDMFSCTGMMIGGEGFNFDEFDTSAATNMDRLFYQVDAKALADSGVLSKIDSTNVTSMESMFYILSNVTNAETVTLDMSSFDTSDVTKMAYFLSGIGGVKNLIIDMSSFDFGSVTDLPSGPYTKLIKLPSEIDSILIYVKDQAAKDFVMANSGIEGDYGGYTSFTDAQVVIK